MNGDCSKSLLYVCCSLFLCAQNNDLCVSDFVEGKVVRAIKSVSPLGALLVLL